MTGYAPSEMGHWPMREHQRSSLQVERSLVASPYWSFMVAVLFARADSVYKTLPDTDVYDIERDARTWPGGCQVVAHPPCRAWGRLRTFAKPRKGERLLATWSVRKVREYGGVLEHPVGSQLWKKAGLPAPGQRDKYGGWTLPIHQQAFGHRAEKATLLYIVGCDPCNIPMMPFVIGEATHVVQSRKRFDHRPHISKAEREHTPIDLAIWLVELAQRCKPPNQSITAAKPAAIFSSKLE